MKRSLIVCVLLLCTLNQAYASHSQVNFRDMIRPHGHKRSAAIGNANIEFCYRKTGLTRYEVDTQAFKDCMMTRGYRWVSTTTASDPPEAKPADDSFIDPDTGMSCRDVGGGALCVPPQGTVHYQNRHGLNCTRTGIASVCSNL
jgi:hypothetical protein